jgi:putative FmdB family regulatory protein
MPIYEYQCRECGEHFEVMQKISDAPLTECRACGGALEKQWSQTSFQLKGGGWYVSDYGKGGGKTEKSEAATDSAKTDGKASESAGASEPAKSEPAATKADKSG